jgi:hypothetical protein
MMSFYKYRSLQNWQFLLDILLNSRLYAAKFEDLNDPMEGLFKYEQHSIDERLLSSITEQKKQYKICSFSRTGINDLMWSYYADGHKGICIEMQPKSQRIFEVNYDGIATLKRPSDQNDFVHEVLSRKEQFWRHEEESRVITDKTFVKISIRRVIFGKKIPSEHKALLSKLLDQLRIDHIDRDDLPSRNSPPIEFINT